MKIRADKTQDNKSGSGANAASQKSDSESVFQFFDNRPEAIAQRKLKEIANNSFQVKHLKTIQEMADTGSQAKQVTQLQAMTDNYSGQQFSIQKKENKTGLPYNLRSGIENLSGYSMDDVKVYYNSDKPAQLQAHAYTQGTTIHIASGQEKHLPHEAWHVVQQKQGRVNPTLQTKGIEINDNEGLERDADLMGDSALKHERKAREGKLREVPLGEESSNPLQGVWYVRGIQNPANMAWEIQNLQRASPLAAGTFGGNNAYQQPVEINTWLSGGVGLATTRYNPGQNQYYSPVGFIVDIIPANEMGHYLGDGNTTTLGSHRPQYFQAFEMIRAQFIGNALINGELNLHGYAAHFVAAINNLVGANALRIQIEAFLQNGAVTVPAKAQARTIIQNVAVNRLQDYYQNGGFPAAQGPIVTPAFTALETNLRGLPPGQVYNDPNQGGRAIKYTESVVNAQLANVIGTYYAAEPGQYPDVINAAWKIGDPNFLYNRASAANQFKNQFIALPGNNGLNLMKLQGGNIANTGIWDTGHLIPPGFWTWAKLTLGVLGAAALYYYAWPLLAPYVARYIANAGHEDL